MLLLERTENLELDYEIWLFRQQLTYRNEQSIILIKSEMKRIVYDHNIWIQWSSWFMEEGSWLIGEN